MSTPTLTSRQKACLVAYATQNKKALEPIILDLDGVSELTDFFVIASGNTGIQVRTILQEVERVCHEEHIPIYHVEGSETGTWVLIDLGDVVVHVFRQPKREFYNLEHLWRKAARVALPKL